MIRSRHLLAIAAALPLLQFGACGGAVGQTTLLVNRQLPSILLDSLASAVLQTVLSILGLSSQSIFGNGTGGTGFAGS